MKNSKEKKRESDRRRRRQEEEEMVDLRISSPLLSSCFLLPLLFAEGAVTRKRNLSLPHSLSLVSAPVGDRPIDGVRRRTRRLSFVYFHSGLSVFCVSRGPNVRPCVESSFSPVLSDSYVCFESHSTVQLSVCLSVCLSLAAFLFLLLDVICLSLHAHLWLSRPRSRPVCGCQWEESVCTRVGRFTDGEASGGFLRF